MKLKYFLLITLSCMVSTNIVLAQTSNPASSKANDSVQTGHVYNASAATGLAPENPDERVQTNRMFAAFADAQDDLAQGQYVLAEADARKSLAIDPKLASYLLAAALNSEGKTQEAFQVYQQVVLEQNDIQSQNLVPYALLALEAGQYQPALDAYNEAVTQLPSGAIMHAGEPANGLAPIDKKTAQPVALATSLHIAQGLLYSAYFTDLGRNLGLAQYRQAVQLSPDSALANFYYGLGLQNVKQYAQAKDAYTQAAALDHGDVQKAAQDALNILACLPAAQANPPAAPASSASAQTTPATSTTNSAALQQH